MARDPELVRAFVALGAVVNRPNSQLAHGLKPMAAHIASAAAGCRYCQAHTAESAARMGVPIEKLQDLWLHETSPRFTEAERAALAFAQAAGSNPNTVEQPHFERLRLHFRESAILELVALISFFGFLNRWNDSLATQLEDAPARFAAQHLELSGWTPGKHGTRQVANDIERAQQKYEGGPLG